MAEQEVVSCKLFNRTSMLEKAMREYSASQAGVNFRWLMQNPYPGRGIVVGATPNDRFLVQVYWIMGRSANSRNRVFSVDGGRVFTEAADPAKVKDPSLIIYNAINQYRTLVYVVSNGDQTDTVMLAAQEGGYVNLDWALRNREYEPDAPNFTPRITATFEPLRKNGCSVNMSILRKSPWGQSCDRLNYGYDEIHAGFGFCITTYSGDGDPLPDFVGEPMLMPVMSNDIDAVLKDYWEALNEANRVSLAVKFIPLEAVEAPVVRVINKYVKVAPAQ